MLTQATTSVQSLFKHFIGFEEHFHIALCGITERSHLSRESAYVARWQHTPRTGVAANCHEIPHDCARASHDML